MNGRPSTEETITVTCITECPTIMVHAGKQYKAVLILEQLFHFFDIQHIKTLMIVLKHQYSLQLLN